MSNHEGRDASGSRGRYAGPVVHGFSGRILFRRLLSACRTVLAGGGPVVPDGTVRRGRDDEDDSCRVRGLYDPGRRRSCCDCCCRTEHRNA